MMYSEKLVVAIKSNKQVLKENKGTIQIPFGKEFSIFLKNLNSVRAQAKVSIDGSDVLNGTSLIIDANSELELERYLKDLSTGNKFKFISRTEEIEEHRGIKAEDGLVRVEFQFEKVLPKWEPDKIYYRDPSDYYGSGGYKSFVGSRSSGMILNSTKTKSLLSSNSCSTQASSDVGITVPGSISNQKFNMVQGFLLEDEKHVIVLHLTGMNENEKPVIKPVTVKAKPRCVTCGTINKATHKFCGKCGTSLVIV